MKRSRVLSSRLRRSAIVMTKSGDAYRGVLFEADELAFVMRNAEQIAARSERGPVPVDGEVMILAAEVLFVQFIDPTPVGK